MPAARPSAGTVAAALTVLAALTGCAHDAGGPAPLRAQAIAPEAVGAGRQHVLVRRVDPAASTVTVDVVQLLTGPAAARACAEDGVPAHRGGLCDTYYLRDRSPRLATLPVRPGADVRAGSCTGPRPATLRQLAAGLPRHRFFRLEFTAGAVTGLAPVCPEGRPGG